MKTKIIWFAIVVCYAGLIISMSPYYGVQDDVHAAISGKAYGYGLAFKELGLFRPMNRFEVHVIAWILKPFEMITGKPLCPVVFKTPALFYLLSAGMFLASCMLIRRIVRGLHLSVEVLVIGALLLVNLTVVNNFFTIFSQEKYMLPCILFMSLFFVRTRTQGVTMSLATAVFFGIVILFQKEASIGAVAAMAVGFWYKYRGASKDPYDKAFAIGLVIAAGLFLALYAVLIVPHIKLIYAISDLSLPMRVLKSAFEWGIEEPVAILVFPAIAGIKWVLNLRKKDNVTTYDVIALGGVGYLAAILVSVGHQSYYLLPVYGFAIPFLIDLLFRQNWIKKPFASRLVSGALLVTLTNVLLGVNQIIFIKDDNRHFIQTMNVLADIVKKEQSRGKIPVLHILDGRDQSSTYSQPLGFYWLPFNKCRGAQFDISSFEEAKDSSCLKMFEVVPYFSYSYMRGRVKKPVSGDYILYTPYTMLKPGDYAETPNGLEVIHEWKSTSIARGYNLKDMIRGLVYRTPFAKRWRLRDLYSVKNATYALYRVR